MMEHIVRRTIANPRDIEFGPPNTARCPWRKRAITSSSTPDPLQWDCFRFGVIQGEDHFTFYVSIDHLHVDGQFVGVGRSWNSR